MPDSNFIDARKFVFNPFPHPLHPDETGDSGLLELAYSKIDANEQYVVKLGNEYPEVASNEFIYHKVASALNLYTQDVRLINGNKIYRRSAGIRYVPNAREFHFDSGTSEHYRAFFEFEALYVILCESDSHEYYLDEQGRLFKLDNASSFTVEQTTIMLFDGNPVGSFFIPDINVPLNAVGYDWYGLKHNEFFNRYGDDAVKAYLSVIERFAEFDETVLFEAYGDLEKQYPLALCRYYDECIRIRKETCRRFLGELANGNT